MQLPELFTKRMEELLDEEEFKALLHSYTMPRYKGIRTNTLKCSPETMTGLVPFETQRVPWCPTGYYIDEDIRPGKNPAYYAGLYYVQEPTAMTSAEALDPAPGDWVLDLCAAPGGKTTQLACKLGGEGLLVANELVANRSTILASNVERMGIANAIILNEFPEHLVDTFYQSFDKILVDAPCSGEGMFRKEPAALSEWSPERVERCGQRQLKILETVDKLLKPGGVLVYSTCTFAPAENEEVVATFMEHYPYVTEAIDLEGLVDHGRPQWTKNGELAVAHTLRVMPYHVRGEGHFVARLRKAMPQELTEEARPKKSKGRTKLKGASSKDLVDYLSFSKDYLVDISYDNLHRMGDRLYALPPGLSPERLKGLRTLRPGLHLGDFKKNRFEPSHTLAMALKPQNFAQTYCVRDDDEAYAYLKGEPLKSAQNVGWTLVCSFLAAMMVSAASSPIFLQILSTPSLKR